MARSEQAPETPAGVPAPTGGTGPVDSPPDAEAASAEGNLGATIAALTEDDLEPARRTRLLGRLVGQVRARGLGDLFRPRAAIRWMSDVVGEVVPHIPIRDRETLRRHYGGLDGDALAERLIRNAARATAGVGAAGGGVAAVEWAVTPSLLSAPVLLAAETIAVVTIEIKLIGELHEAYGVPVPGSTTQRAGAMIQSWASRRGVNPFLPGMGVSAVLGAPARKQLRDMLLRRFGRNLTTLGPLLTGAAVAGYLNRRATLGLGDAIRTDLRKQFRAITGPPQQGHGAELEWRTDDRDRS
ncbi:hypothetical protein BDK92_5324 [Micromonospora pisi]|uniref:EcsC family protein n=1 Tax=Micromonospora pisi TaxID=589240 RepID=A0A495JPM1_9ACTN|nr:hypothetical protein BDK92_5324 [Micromonospora pisi]